MCSTIVDAAVAKAIAALESSPPGSKPSQTAFSQAKARLDRIRAEKSNAERALAAANAKRKIAIEAVTEVQRKAQTVKAQIPATVKALVDAKAAAEQAVVRAARLKEFASRLAAKNSRK
ncbi:MAG: hypothetical protein IH914_02100 [candidate division Zixibacteria bacterium]|nr:hypothetical protein [candidate division Zixibacteria bacterium]